MNRIRGFDFAKEMPSHKMPSSSDMPKPQDFRDHLERFYVHAVLKGQEMGDEESEMIKSRCKIMMQVQKMLDVIDLFTLGRMYQDIDAQRVRLEEVVGEGSEVGIAMARMLFQVMAATDSALNPKRKPSMQGVEAFTKVCAYIKHELGI